MTSSRKTGRRGLLSPIGFRRAEVRVVATPIVIGELKDSHFRGIPDWFPVDVEPESVVVLRYARLGMIRLGNGEVFTTHRGESTKTKDAIMADSANSLADIFVSEDRRCRNRLSQVSTKCCGLSWLEFRQWLFSRGSIRGLTAAAPGGCCGANAMFETGG